MLDVGQPLADALRRFGHGVAVASSVKETLSLTAERRFDAIVLGGVKQGRVSARICGELRRDGLRAPILLLVGDDAAENRVEGLDAGADDCVAASCSLPELLARLRALVRRAERTRAS